MPTTAQLVAEIIERYNIPVEEAEPDKITGYVLDDNSIFDNKGDQSVQIVFKYFGERDRIWGYESKTVITESTTRVS